jgi:hypothetical protein
MAEESSDQAHPYGMQVMLLKRRDSLKYHRNWAENSPGGKAMSSVFINYK